MARVTNAMRVRMRDDAYSRLACECGHPRMGHHELKSYWWELAADGQMVEVANPDYRPEHFHCDIQSCSCVRVIVR